MQEAKEVRVGVLGTLAEREVSAPGKRTFYEPEPLYIVQFKNIWKNVFKGIHQQNL